MKLKIKQTKCIPLRGYAAMTVFPFIFTRKSPETLTATTIRHEYIHGWQQLEMLVVPFYVWYGVEYLIRLAQYGDARLAYRNISFEREAYRNEHDEKYLQKRRLFAWVKWL